MMGEEEYGESGVFESKGGGYAKISGKMYHVMDHVDPYFDRYKIVPGMAVNIKYKPDLNDQSLRHMTRIAPVQKQSTSKGAYQKPAKPVQKKPEVWKPDAEPASTAAPNNVPSQTQVPPVNVDRPLMTEKELADHIGNQLSDKPEPRKPPNFDITVGGTINLNNFDNFKFEIRGEYRDYQLMKQELTRVLDGIGHDEPTKQLVNHYVTRVLGR